MRIKQTIVTMIMLLVITVLSAEEYHKYYQVLVKTFPVGTESNELGVKFYIDPGLDPEGPSAINFDKDGRLYIVDFKKNRILIYDQTFNTMLKIIENTPIVQSTEIEIDTDYNLIGYYFLDKIHKVDKNGNTIFSVDIQNLIRNYNIRENTFLVENNMIFTYDSKNELLSIPVKGKALHEKVDKALGVKKTQEIMKSASRDSNYELSKLAIDTQGRLFRNDELLTKDYKTFYQYWKEQHDKNKSVDKNKIKVSFDIGKLSNTTFIGKDNDGNYYWDAGWIWVFDKDAWVIDFFKYSRDPGKIRTSVVVHPSGDLYFLDYDSTAAYLYRINRVW